MTTDKGSLKWLIFIKRIAPLLLKALSADFVVY